jgi:hypothetical protein
MLRRAGVVRAMSLMGQNQQAQDEFPLPLIASGCRPARPVLEPHGRANTRPDTGSLQNRPSHRTSRSYLSLSLGLLLAFANGTAAARTVGPTADYKIDPEHTVTSPDKTTTVEQYARINADGDYAWQFWARHQDQLTQLKPEQPDYPAGFRFTNDSQWLVRMQKTGSGEASLYLYHRGPQGFVAATAKPLGDLAWAYFKSLPDSRKIRRPDFHISAGLVQGTDDNYRSLGETWPDSRYLVILLWGELLPNDRHGQVRLIRGWHCRYDLQKGKFDVPPDFADNNAKAIAPEKE